MKKLEIKIKKIKEEVKEDVLHLKAVQKKPLWAGKKALIEQDKLDIKWKQAELHALKKVAGQIIALKKAGKEDDAKQLLAIWA